MLDSVLRRLPRPNDPNLLVGYETSDDAGVYRLSDELALVQTVDFLTPIVDDPFRFGQIAAANSLSDVYAMGGRPVSALSLVGFPPAAALEILEQILRGGLSKMEEAGCTVVGGHTIRDEELKFGYAVTGVIRPQCIWRNVGAREGDVLLLTKPIGTGVIATALKQGIADSRSVEAAADSMATLNRAAAEAFAALDPSGKGAAGPVHAVTDVTGFGLLGHAREMAAGSGVSFELNCRGIAVLPGAREAAHAGALAGGLHSNREFLEGCVEFADSVSEEFRNLLFDPQTSGGLLAAIAPDAAARALKELTRSGIEGRRIGDVIARRSPLLRVT